MDRGRLEVSVRRTVLGASRIFGGARRRRCRLAGIGLIALAVLPIAGPMRVEAEGLGVRQIGFLANPDDVDYRRLLVDPELNLGFAFGQNDGGNWPFLVYDLEGMKLLASLTPPSAEINLGSQEEAFVDGVHHRVFFPTGGGGAAQSCPSPDGEKIEVFDARSVFDPAREPWSTKLVPCTSDTPVPRQFAVLGISYHAPSDKLYAVGMNWPEWQARQLQPTTTNSNEPSYLLRQMDAGTMALDWEINLNRAVGCDGMFNLSTPPVVTRVGDAVLSQCAIDNLGFALRVPLEDDEPIATGAGPGADSGVHASQSMGGSFPLVDPGSGRMLFLTTNEQIGKAVWVYDPPHERFYGVIASGLGRGAGEGHATMLGFDEATGRVYLLTAAGLLLADARHDPLPSGVDFQEITSPKSDAEGTVPDGHYVSVAPKLRRLFLADKGGWRVLQDEFPEPLPPIFEDPDAGTEDIPEEAGKTGRVYSGLASGYGAHLLNTGGVTKLIDQNLSCAAEQCPAGRVFSSGNREMFLGATSTEMGSDTGAVSTATGGGFSSSDAATDADLRRLGACEEDLIRKETGLSPGEDFQEGCVAVQDGLTEHFKIDFRKGTTGAEGKGFPVPGSHCEDFGDGATNDGLPSGSDGFPWNEIAASSVACDAAASATTANARFAVPVRADPTFSVAHASSDLSAKLTAEGVVTTATATATGVTIGPFSIGSVITTATTKARGRTGTTVGTFTRDISDVRGPGLNCAVCDEQEVVDGMNRAFGRRMKVRIPTAEEFASPRGYQGTVIKDPRQRDSDSTLNDDDTSEAAGLEIVFFNDGRLGRSRVVVHLAGVRAESRYGIFRLADFGGFGPPPPPPELGGAFEPGTSFEPPVDDGADDGGTDEGNVVTKILRYPVEAVGNALRLIVTNPREFFLLFGMWALLGAPLYLRWRRYAAARALAG